ncbi:hypothetical protein DP107_18665 [Haloglomus irregulare]|uniref:Uncharacterized protein n=1 Tax=Haloglomus irregulare TaxID=2234134 RepID=A0A554MU83_9EURY|nr:hypothetical protein [Haloglomus irregulare]TSD08693.1 hypothetical protein DP107_18665 [Haloglomus irregulare]
MRAILKGNSDDEPAEIAADLVQELHDTDYIEDYSQVAFLFNSTKENSNWAGPFVDALRERGIPIHNPRNKAYLEYPEIRFALGAVIRCLDLVLDGLEIRNIMGGVRNQVEEWHGDFEGCVDEYDAHALERYVTSIEAELDTIDDGESLGLTLLDVLYRILSFEPFRTWIESQESPVRGKRLGRLTQLFDSFDSVAGRSTLTASSRANSVSTMFLGDFYYLFCGYLNATDFDELLAHRPALRTESRARPCNTRLSPKILRMGGVGWPPTTVQSRGFARPTRVYTVSYPEKEECG